LLGVEDALQAPAVAVNVLDLGLVLREEGRKNGSSSSSTPVDLNLLDELPSVEETPKVSAVVFEASRDDRG
jgi:hypothetical protein